MREKPDISGFEAGRIGVALELLTQIKILQSLPLTADSARMEGALNGFLVDQKLLDEAEKWYERLDAWRQPRFNAEGVGVRGDASSVRATPEGAVFRTRRIRAWHEEHRGQDDSSTSETEPPPDAVT